MPNVETGNLARLAFIQEAVFGTTPASPVGQILRHTGFNLDADRKYIDNPELRLDGLVAAGVGGALRGKGSIPGRLSYGTYDMLLAAALGNFDWTANVIKIAPVVVSSAATIAIDSSAKTWTRADGGSFIADGFVVGDRIDVSGAVNAGNNSTFVLTAVSALVLTASAATLVTESASATVEIVRNNRPSFSMEKSHLVNGMNFPFTGVVVDGLELSGKVNDSISVKFDVLSKAVGNESTTSIFTSFTPINTANLITSWNGSIKKDTVTIANVTDWSIKLARNSDIGEVCGSSALYDIRPKATKVTGSLQLYFDNYALYTAMRNDADVAFQINLGPGGTTSYTIDITKARIKKWTAEPKDGLMVASVEFESFAPNSGTNTSLMITRLP
jgi:hypothetical protein